MPLLKLRVQLKNCHSRHQDNVLVSGTDLQTDAEEPSKLPQRKLVLLAMFSCHPWWEKPLTCFLFLQRSETPPSCSVTTADSSLSITFPHRLHREPHFAVGFRIPTGKGQLVSSCSWSNLPFSLKWRVRVAWLKDVWMWSLTSITYSFNTHLYFPHTCQRRKRDAGHRYSS